MMAFLKTFMLAGVLLFVVTPSVSGDCSAGLNSVLNGHCLQNNKVPNASVLCKAIVVDVCKTVTLKNVYTTTEIKTYKLAVENKITQNVAMNGNTASAGATADATGITTSTSTTTNAEADAPLVVDGTTVATGSSSSSSSSTAAASNAPVCLTDTTLCNGNCLSITSYQTDANNCGACGTACKANQVCQNGVCTCKTGFGNCNNDAADGCEADFATTADNNNCGACGNVCKANQSCQNGVCTCNPGFGNCDSDAANGCETNLATSVGNCNTCGNTCPGITNGFATCAGGVCGTDCNSPFTKCNNACVNPGNDNNNCGACGNVCQANQSCQNGVCTCNTGFGNCDSSAANGCEVNTMTSTTHCGQCGQACASGQTCTNGACVDAVVPCGASSTFSGGTGTRVTSVTIGTGGNSFNFIYDAQSVPDQFTVKTPSGTVLYGPIVGGTGTCCNGFGALCPNGATASGNNLGGVLINRPAGVSSVVVEVFAPCGGTAWGFTVGCAA